MNPIVVSILFMAGGIAHASSGANTCTTNGLDANAEYQRLAAELQRTLPQPREGESATYNDPSVFQSPGNPKCRFSLTRVKTASGITARGFTLTEDSKFSALPGSPSTCPAPESYHNSSTVTFQDFIRSQLQTMQSLFDVKNDCYWENDKGQGVAQVGMTSSQEASFQVPNSNTQLRTQRVTIDVVYADGSKAQTVNEISLDSWLIGVVRQQYSSEGAPLYTLRQVVSYTR